MQLWLASECLEPSIAEKLRQSQHALIGCVFGAMFGVLGGLSGGQAAAPKAPAAPIEIVKDIGQDGFGKAKTFAESLVKKAKLAAGIKMNTK